MTIRLTWRRVLLGIVALAAAGMLFAWSGIFNVAASSGHWPITNWFLHWTMQNSVRTHAALSTPGDVVDDGGLVSAAGHFAQACASCHGAPGVAPLPVMQRATPHAPNLAGMAGKYSDRQLYWILQHGIKYTGMPAWGATDRPDEVRRMVAFVRRLPGMTAAQYRALSGAGLRGTAAPGVSDRVMADCVACHGPDGRGRGQPDIPVLGGQHPSYLARALADYSSGRRQSAVMAQAAARLSPSEIRALAIHFAGMPGLGDAPGEDAAARVIVERGLPRVQLPACASCHKPGGKAPVIAGQKARYIADRLRHWRGDETIVDARKPQQTMPVIARRIPEKMIDPLARYLAGIGR